jgi:uncharacterized protein YkwD
MPAVEPLRWNDQLYDAAYEHNFDLIKSRFMAHAGSGTRFDLTAQELHPGTGSTVTERIEQNGYTQWHYNGENIAAGTYVDQVEEAMAMWLKSPGHCKNIMKKEFKEVGMAVLYDKKSHFKYYWTQDFGTKH